MLTVSQSAARLDLTRARVRALIIAGALKAKRLGPPPHGVYMIEEADLESFAELDRRPGRPRGKANGRG